MKHLSLEQDEERNYILKMIVFGNSGVGKSSLIYRFVNEKFSTDFKSTIGVDFAVMYVELPEVKTKIKMTLWDFSGNKEDYMKIRQVYLQGTNTVFLVCSLNDIESIKDLEFWKNELRTCGNGTSVTVLANKADLVEEIAKGNIELAISWANKNNYDLYQTSAKNGKNVKEAFRQTARKHIGA